MEGRKQENLKDQLDTAVEDLSNLIQRHELNRVLCQMKRHMYKDILRKRMKLVKKLKLLRREKQMRNPTQVFTMNDGSRKVESFIYVLNVTSAISGAPFPTNLRLHRRRRPNMRTRNLNPQEFQISEQELAKRDPVILTKKEGFTLPEAGKTLMRMGPKTAPTPRTPVDEKAQYEAWLKWRESGRWKWHFCKGMEPKDIEEYVKKPWDVPTDRAAPIAQDCPQLEAMFAQSYTDLFDPKQRKLIKDNLTPEQRDFIKTVKTDYPEQGLRVRTEDKGNRYVIEDAETEDRLIENHLQNPNQYTELDESPMDEHVRKITEWADKGLRDGELDEKMYN